MTFLTFDNVSHFILTHDISPCSFHLLPLTESEEKEVMSEPSLPTGESVGDEDAPANLSEEEAAAGEMNSDLVGGRTELSCAEEDLKLKPECDSATRQEEDGE